MELEFTESPTAFLAAAETFLAADPVLSTVMSSVTAREAAADARGEERRDHPRWWVLVRDAGRVVGVAMRTAPFRPHPMFVLPMPSGAAVALARAVHERGEHIGGANGALPASSELAEELARLGGHTVSVHERTRLWEADAVVPHSAPGALRAAGPGDVDLATAWWNRFAAEAAEQAGRDPGTATGDHATPADLEQRVAEGLVWLWEDDGEVVHLTAHQPPAYGVVRVGPVFTPREHRGRGYAAAAVAEVTTRVLADGHRACLYTDQANPTSNKIYAAIGYRPVAEMANLLIG